MLLHVVHALLLYMLMHFVYIYFRVHALFSCTDFAAAALRTIGFPIRAYKW